MKLKNLMPFLIAFLTFVILDYFWITLLSGEFYFRSMRPIANMNMYGESIPIRYWSAAGIYALLSLGMMYLVKPQTMPRKDSALNGALFGLVVFGVYNLTNNTTLEHWPIDLFATDVIWGAFSCMLVALGMQKFCRS